MPIVGMKRSSISPTAAVAASWSSKSKTMAAPSTPVRRSQRLSKKLNRADCLFGRYEDEDLTTLSSPTPKTPSTLKTPLALSKGSSTSSLAKSLTPSVSWSAPSFKEIEGRLKYDEQQKKNHAVDPKQYNTHSFDSMVAALGQLSLSPNVSVRDKHRRRSSIAKSSALKIGDEMFRIECNDERAVVNHVVEQESPSPRRSTRLQKTLFAEKQDTFHVLTPTRTAATSTAETATPVQEKVESSTTPLRRSARLQRKRY
jgi:hypothetical protein